MTRLERSVAFVLKAGVLVSTVCLAAGVALSFLDSTLGLSAMLLNAGILVLLCTPVARVVISTIEYAAARDWPFAALTSIVLLELVASAVAALVFNRRV